MAVRLQLAPALARLRAPLVTAGGIYRDRPGVVVTLDAGDGRVGQGEATPLVEFGTEALERTRSILELAAATLTRRALPETVGDVGDWVDSFVPADAPAARHALECAALEVLAATLGTPVTALLGAAAARAPRKELPVNALLSARDTAALEREAADAAGAGFGTVKLKVGTGDDLNRVAAVRDAIGPRVRLRLDANGGWPREKAIERLESFVNFVPELCEQPVAADDLEGLAWVRARTTIAIAADESLGIPGGPETLLQPGVVDVLALKPMVLGGLLRCIGLAAAARENGQRVYVTSALEGPVARRAAIRLAAVIHDGLAHGLGVAPLFEASDAEEALTPRRGVLPVG